MGIQPDTLSFLYGASCSAISTTIPLCNYIIRANQKERRQMKASATTVVVIMLALIIGIVIGRRAVTKTEFEACFQTCRQTTSLQAENCIAVCSR